MTIDRARRAIKRLGKGRVDADGQAILVPQPLLDRYERELRPYQVLSVVGRQGENRACEGVAVVAERTTHPWSQFAGMFKDDPLFDDWQDSIRRKRLELDEDPDFP